jgi:hypothetical protein
MPNDDKLRAVLDKKLILEDEKTMWLEAGFFIEEPALGSAANWSIYTRGGWSDKLSPDAARDIRSGIVSRWQDRKAKLNPPVKISEAESDFDRIEARSNS